MSGIPAGAGSLVGKRLGKYDILALLALGGTAEIYLARIGGAAGFEKYVVVKCLHDHLADDTEFVKMFLDEARLAAMLDHSNIVQTFELGEHENRYYMVMEFLAGLSLAMVVRRAGERLPGGKIPSSLIFNVAAQACAGLHYAHEKQANGRPLNMVHRDISPQNLVIGFEGVVKVVDFGIARADQRDTKTKAGTIKGKFAYMSPEQCVAANIDRRTDVFALGVIVWELLTGRRLFKRNSPYETYQAVIECNVPTPSSLNHEIDSTIDEIVMRAIAKDKDQRYPSAEAFGDALQKYMHQRAKGSGPAEIGRFFEQYFNQEIEEHGERMRELISAGNFSVDTGVSWGEEEEDKEKRANATVDLSVGAASGTTGDRSMELDSMDIEEVSRERAPTHLEGADVDSGDDEMPAERTRIQLNPLEQIKEMDEAHARASSRFSAVTPVPQGSQATGGPAPLPAPPTGPVRAVGGARFSPMASVPTVVAQDILDGPEHAETAMAPVNDAISAEQPRPPVIPGPMQPMQPPETSGPGSSTHYAVRPSQMQHAQPGPQPSYVQQALPPQMQPAPGPGGLLGYPVLQGGRPYSSDLAPSHLPAPQRSPYAGETAPHPEPHHTGPHSPLSNSAQMISPVGEHYPHAQDWAAAAARPARAMPPWMLALLFVGALGVALMVTILIAKIVR